MNSPESSKVTPPRGTPRPEVGRSASPYLPYALGVLTGILFMLVVVLALIGFGVLGSSGGACPAPGACPPTVPLLPICPTCGPQATSTPTATVTATGTPPALTPNVGATATAACANFSKLFPGTPCPP